MCRSSVSAILRSSSFGQSVTCGRSLFRALCTLAEAVAVFASDRVYKRTLALPLFGSETRHSLQMFGVPGPLHRDLRGGAFDLAEIVGRERDGSRSDVLLKAIELRGARDRRDPGLLRKQPCERDLRGRRLLPLGDLCKQIDQSLVCLPGLRREARDGVA